MEDYTLQITISGKVQHVGFRFSAQHIANKLRINGFVRNLPNGNVEIEASGNSEQLDELEKWCFKGPALAKVTNVFVTKIPYTIFHSFSIK
jgi:acylphosphatase